MYLDPSIRKRVGYSTSLVRYSFSGHCSGWLLIDNWRNEWIVGFERDVFWAQSNQLINHWIFPWLDTTFPLDELNEIERNKKKKTWLFPVRIWSPFNGTKSINGRIWIFYRQITVWVQWFHCWSSYNCGGRKESGTRAKCEQFIFLLHDEGKGWTQLSAPSHTATSSTYWYLNLSGKSGSFIRDDELD